MGYELYREVLEHAPPDLTAPELLVWLVVADDANDKTRTGWIVKDELARKARLKQRTVRAALELLAERGCELRLVRGKDKHGRPVYAHRGAQTTYVLPVLDPAGKVAPGRHLSGGERWHEDVERWHEDVGKGAPERQKAAPACHPSPHPLRSPHSSSRAQPVDLGGRPGDADRETDDDEAASKAAVDTAEWCPSCGQPRQPRPGTYCTMCKRTNHGTTAEEHASAEVERRLNMTDDFGWKVLREIRSRSGREIDNIVAYVGRMSNDNLFRIAQELFPCEGCGRREITDLTDLLCPDCLERTDQP